MELVRSAFTRQIGMVVCRAVLGEVFAIVHFQKSEESKLWRMDFVFAEVFKQGRQFRQFFLYLCGHEGTVQEQSEK